MDTFKKRLVHAASILLVFLVVGCAISNRASPLTKSRFFSQCLNLGTVMDMIVPDKEVVLENNKTPASVSETAAQQWRNSCTFVCGVRCNQERIDKFMQSLRTELRKMAQQAGAEIGMEDEGAELGYLGEFGFEYAVGNAHGVVKANVDAGKTDPDKPGAKAYKLVVDVDEWVH